MGDYTIFFNRIALILRNFVHFEECIKGNMLKYIIFLFEKPFKG